MTKCAKKLNDNDINKRFKILVLHIICLSYFVTVTKGACKDGGNSGGELNE